MVVPLLNGVDHVAVLRARFGHDAVFPATIAVEAESPAPGHFIQRSPGVRLNLVAGAEPVLGGIVASLREIGFTCDFIANEQTLLWSKLCFLAPFALVTSASGKNKGEIDADPQWKAKLISAIGEVSALAKASGAEIDHAKLHALFHSFPPTLRSSMAKDVAAKRPLELDGIAGPIVRGGQRYGIPVPTTTELIARIQSISAG
jgi:2-dehydropantoate 2-reductase